MALDVNVVSTSASGDAQSTKLSDNETSTPLTGGAAYTGAWVDVSAFEAVVFAAKADVAGTLYAQFSNVGTEAAGDTVPSQLTYTTTANSNEVHRLLKTRQYFRIRYVNGASAQSSFHIQVFAGTAGLLTSTLNTQVQRDSDGLIVRSIPSKLEISQNLFTGVTPMYKFGRNSDVDSGNEDVWEGGGTYTGMPTTVGETVEVFSSDANDDDGDTGARTMTIFGLDANWEEQSETLTLNGTTAVTSTGTYVRVNRAVILTAGSSGSNEGTITCRHTTTTANIFFIMQAGRNQTSVAAFTVPANKTLYISEVLLALTRANGSGGSGNVTLRVRPEGGVFLSTLDLNITTAYEQIIRSDFYSFPVPAKADIKWRVDDVSDTNSTVSATLIGVLIDD